MYVDSLQRTSQVQVDVENHMGSSASLFGSGAQQHYTRSWNQIKDERREKEMAEWLPLLLSVPQATELGKHLQMRRLRGEGDATLRQASIDEVVAIRGQTGSSYDCGGGQEALENYLAHLHDSGASGSSSIQLYRTALFAEHVLGGCVKDVAKNKTVLAYVSAARGRVKGRTQRRPLTTAEVVSLECLVLNGEANMVHRVIAGSLLFALYSRARWSELGACLSLATDKMEAEGFIE
eukprot:2653713-Amphidinium_carterae.1